MNYPTSIPSNASLWSLNKLMEASKRRLDYADSESDFLKTSAFISELQSRIIKVTSRNRYLEDCLKANHHVSK